MSNPTLTIDIDRPLTEEEKLWVFRRATSAFAKHNAEAIARGMTDDQIAEALERSLGILGGRDGPGDPWLQYQGAGLKIWGGWTFGTSNGAPLFAGRVTVVMARRIYSIPDPTDRQLSLL